MPNTTKLIGGLGNQLFQIANCIAHSLRHNMDYQVPQELANGYKKYPVYFSHFPPLTMDLNDFGTVREPEDLSYREIPRREQVCFDGYFQSWKYFWDFREQVFDLIRPGFAEAEKLLKPMAESDVFKDAVAMHVRRGDYVEYSDVHPPISLEYFKNAMQVFMRNGINKFFVFSDDIEWCKEQFTTESFKDSLYSTKSDTLVQFMDEKGKDRRKDDLFDMYAMSKFDHQVISNSTFSLWAAMLNKNPNKIVISPDAMDWYGPAATYSAKDIIPETFSRIRSDQYNAI